MTGSCQIRRGVKASQNGTSPLTPFTYFVFGVISLVGVNDYFVVVYVSKTKYQRTVHVASMNYDVINLIYNVIGVTWHHL